MDIEELLRQVRDGQMEVAQAKEALKNLPYED